MERIGNDDPRGASGIRKLKPHSTRLGHFGKEDRYNVVDGCYHGYQCAHRHVTGGAKQQVRLARTCRYTGTTVAPNAADSKQISLIRSEVGSRFELIPVVTYSPTNEWPEFYRIVAGHLAEMPEEVFGIDVNASVAKSAAKRPSVKRDREVLSVGVRRGHTAIHENEVETRSATAGVEISEI